MCKFGVAGVHSVDMGLNHGLASCRSQLALGSTSSRRPVLSCISWRSLSTRRTPHICEPSSASTSTICSRSCRNIVSRAGSGDSIYKYNSELPEKGRESGRLPSVTGNGVFLLLLINVVVFLLDHVAHLPAIKMMYLNHANPQWWQWLSHAFCHGSWDHLSMNLFNLCVFGKLVEETEGGLGLWAIYIITALGAAAASFFTTPAVWKGAVTVSVGASGAIFGLFAVSVLTRLKMDLRRLLEAAILGNFVVRQVLGEAKAQMAGGLVIGGMQVAHIAHLGGALAGVLLVFLLSRIPEKEP